MVVDRRRRTEPEEDLTVVRGGVEDDVAVVGKELAVRGWRNKRRTGWCYVPNVEGSDAFRACFQDKREVQ